MRTVRTHTPAELLKKKADARRLIIEKGLTQKEVAKMVGVGENTMCKWVKQYGWISSHKAQLQRLNDSNLERFVQYVKEKDPQTFRKILGHLSRYLLTEARK